MTSYQPLPLCDATLKMIDQTIANDQVGVLGHRFDLSQYKELLEEADDVADYFSHEEKEKSVDSSSQR